MAILDGHERQSACHLTELIGEAWKARVGADKGSYFNCYAKRHRYRYNGLGKVHLSDTEKLIGLRVAFWYMSKQDSVLLVDDARVKNFRRSLMPKGTSNRGAPRRHGDGMDLPKRILGGERSLYPPDFNAPNNRTSSGYQSLIHGESGMRAPCSELVRTQKAETLGCEPAKDVACNSGSA